jgi:hypothetical protein
MEADRRSGKSFDHPAVSGAGRAKNVAVSRCLVWLNLDNCGLLPLSPMTLPGAARMQAAPILKAGN